MALLAEIRISGCIHGFKGGGWERAIGGFREPGENREPGGRACVARGI